MMNAPVMAMARPIIIPRACNLLKTYFSIKKVKTGAKVPKKVAFAIVVSLIAAKKRVKWIPKKIPARMVLFRCLGDRECCDFTALHIHKIPAPIAMRQKEIATAGTSER